MNEPDIQLVQTCYAYPEQYDAFIGDRQVGYLRLSHGEFRVDYPNSGGETIYVDYPKGDGFFEHDEREYYLLEAKKAILNYELNNALNMSEKLQQIKDEYARENDRGNWDVLLAEWPMLNMIPMREMAYNEVARRYAKACSAATQQNCAEKAKALWEPTDGPVVTKVVILDPSNIVIL